MAGVTSTGLQIKDYNTLKSEIESDEFTNIDASLDVSSETFLGQLNAIMADQFDQAWQALAQVYAAAYRSTAQGAQLDAIGALTGTTRLPATKSTSTVVAVGTNGTLLPAGRVMSVSGAATSRFATSLDYTIQTLSAWAISTPYVVGDLRTNDSGKIYCCIQAGTSAGFGGPTGTGTSITDGGCKWYYVATGTAAVLMAVTAESTGPTVANAGSLSVIETPVSGWTSVKNALNATIGRNVETDAAYRLRQAASLTITGAATPDAIRADVLAVSGVTAAFVFENVTDVTDGNGVPPHAMEVLVLGGLDQDIRNAIWSSKPAGIATYGSTSGTVTDSAGSIQTVNFSRPTAVPFYVTVTLQAETANFPADGVAQIQQALVNFWSTKTMGDDVVRSQLFAPIDAISGTYDITNIQLGTSPSPVGTSNIVISSRQLATLVAANVVVNVSYV